MRFTIFIFFFLVTFSYSQIVNDTLKKKELNEVVVHSKKLNQPQRLLSQKINVITQQEIMFQNFQNTADVLAGTGTATVQKSQQGGGSPVLRGFEASRILLLVDCIRMNNLIFRAGHLQNIITVDENMLDGVEVFYGSSSSLFGSDALGGAINLNTKKAQFSTGKDSFSGSFLSRYSTVNEEKSGHIGFNFGFENFASLTSFSYADFGDLKMGRKRNGKNSFFGEREFYIKTIDGQDVQVVNANKYVQKFSGYKQYDFMQKFALQEANGNQHLINFQFSTSTNIPRYDRLTDSNDNGLLNAAWFYGPQKRILGVYTFEKRDFLLQSDLTANVAYQNVEESRHNRRVNNYNLQNRQENVSVYSIDFTLKKKFSKIDLLYGFESYYDDLNSTAYRNNITTGEIQLLDTRYPNGGNSMFRNDLFFYFNQVLSPRTHWNVGGRIGYVTLNSSVVDTLFPLPFTRIQQQNVTYSGLLGITHKPCSGVSLIGNLSTGYRVPNIDDLSKVFESGAGTVVVPNENLQPEKTVTVDLGLHVSSATTLFEWDFNYYYTRFFDAIVTDAFTFNGSSTIMYDGVLSTVLANQNKGNAFITGFSTGIKWYLLDELQLSCSYTYTLGRVVDEHGNYSPLDHIPPHYGRMGIRYFKKLYAFDLYMLYNGKKDIKDYLLNGEDNEQYAPIGGMPAWQTYNVKLSYTVLKNATLYAGVENILDIQYRTFASGMNAPGRNIYAGLQINY